MRPERRLERVSEVLPKAFSLNSGAMGAATARVAKRVRRRMVNDGFILIVLLERIGERKDVGENKSCLGAEWGAFLYLPTNNATRRETHDESGSAPCLILRPTLFMHNENDLERYCTTFAHVHRNSK